MDGATSTSSFPGPEPGADPQDDYARDEEIQEQIAQVMGGLNVGFGQLVIVAKAALDEGRAGGHGLRSPGHWLAWRSGLAIEHANAIIALARRFDELPATIGLLTDGALTLDQAAVIARHVPAAYEAAAADFATRATVRQLRQNLAKYGFDPDPDPDPDRSPGAGPEARPESASLYQEGDGGFRLGARLDADRGALFQTALDAARDELYQRRKADAPDGTLVEVSMADALIHLAERSLDAQASDRPGSERFLIHLHLEAGADAPVLTSHLGAPVPGHIREMLLCDCQVRVNEWRDGQPIASGRKHRTVPARYRVLIEHRDGGCTVPGCGRTRGLHIHHIIHWLFGGETEPDNLLTVCEHHHRQHHQGLLGIARTPGVAPGQEGWITFTNHCGLPVAAVGRPKPCARPQPAEDVTWEPKRPALRPGTPAANTHRAIRSIGLEPTRYRCPTGEPIRARDVSLRRSDPPRGPD